MEMLTVVIPCFDEGGTLERCVERVLALQGDDLGVEILVVDDASRDQSLAIARALAAAHPEVRVLRHEKNRGKGAALRTGFAQATGDFVAIQDADLEYDPLELRGLLVPLREGHADVVFGSRFTGSGPHRVLYFWHSLGNAFLTFVSNMFTDLNLTDMETCYKVFRREVLQTIEIEEDRFGFEPEITAKIARKRLRIYEMGISYHGRTYEEGKKIGWRDGVQALYCVFRYNAWNLPWPVQFLAYLCIGGAAAGVNLLLFLALLTGGLSGREAAGLAFVVAAALNYYLCIRLLFRHRARWNSGTELLLYCAVVALVGTCDVAATVGLCALGSSPWLAKTTASLLGVVLNFAGRRYWVFPEKRTGKPPFC